MGHYRVAQWARHQAPAPRRGVLKWIFIGLLLAGMGVLLMPNRVPRPASWNATHRPHLIQVVVDRDDADPGIAFTFTGVELRDEEASRWLAMEYIPQIRGDCERAFPWQTTVPGWSCDVRSSTALVDSGAGFGPVRHGWVAWKLPEALDTESAMAFRDRVSQRWLRKQLVVAVDTEQTLFELSLPNGKGTLTARVAVHPVEERP